MKELRGKAIWITGASSGIGAALAHALSARGARLLLSARRAERLAQVAQTCRGAEVRTLPFDLGDLTALPARAAEAERLMGPLDVMVHNAGVGQRGSVRDTDFAVERRMLETNFLSPVALTKALLPGMLARGGGQFVVVSSVLGLMSVKHRAGYCASKHALHGYFNALRAEHSADGISVLLVCPGHVRTEFSQVALEADGRPHGVVDPGQQHGITAEACAAKIVSGLSAGKAEIYPAKWEALGVYLNRAAPGLLRRVLARAEAR